MYEVEKYWKSILQKWDEKVWKMSVEEDKGDYNYELWKKTRKSAMSRNTKLKTSNGVNSCVSIAKTLMANYSLEFDTKQDLFGCENGVIDLAEECFRPYRFDDFITFSCGYQFTPLLHDFKVIDKKVIVKKLLKVY